VRVGQSLLVLPAPCGPLLVVRGLLDLLNGHSATITPIDPIGNAPRAAGRPQRAPLRVANVDVAAQSSISGRREETAAPCGSTNRHGIDARRSSRWGREGGRRVHRMIGSKMSSTAGRIWHTRVPSSLSMPRGHSTVHTGGPADVGMR
jgi:hypothetical protein